MFLKQVENYKGIVRDGFPGGAATCVHDHRDYKRVEMVSGDWGRIAGQIEQIQWRGEGGGQFLY